MQQALVEPLNSSFENLAHFSVNKRVELLHCHLLQYLQVSHHHDGTFPPIKPVHEVMTMDIATAQPRPQVPPPIACSILEAMATSASYEMLPENKAEPKRLENI